MPVATINRLTERGQAAGDLLRRRFAPPSGDGTDLTWDNHRWVRYRSMMSLLETTTARLAATYLHPEPGDVPIDQLSLRPMKDPPKGYPWASQAQRDFARQATAQLVKLIEDWRAAGQSFTKRLFRNLVFIRGELERRAAGLLDSVAPGGQLVSVCRPGVRAAARNLTLP